MRNIVLLILSIISFINIDAQNNIPILERKVTIKITGQPLGKVMNIISETADFNFSYGNNVIKVSKIVTIHADNRSVKDVLDQLFNGEITYQQIGNHLILQKKVIPKNTNKIQSSQGKPVKYRFLISGYLRDAASGDGLPNVSLYEKQTLATSLSGDFGYYRLDVTGKTPDISVKISGQGLRDTVLQVHYENNGVISLNVNLQPLVPPVKIEEFGPVYSDTPEITPVDTPLTRQDSVRSRIVWNDSFIRQLPFRKIKVEETEIGKWFINKYQRLSADNIRDSFERDWQLTFVPPVGSNGILSGLVSNKVSFNVLVGYNGGLNGAEFGGLVNILKRDMSGAQFAGLSNIVGGNASGAQFAGLFNNNLGNCEGFQGAGLFNQNFGTFSGSQLSGLYNYNHSWSEGFQAAGLLNINRGGLSGCQIGGVGNYAGKESSLVQVAGVFNVANKIDGGQIGVINIARKIRGFQIGIINVADSSYGPVIGIINFIKNGTHQLEGSLNELSQYGLAYRSGSEKFYSKLMVTTQLPMDTVNTLMSYGFGLGTNIKLSNTFRITTDIGSYHQSFNFRSTHLNLLNRVNADLEIKLMRGISVFGGASLNHLIADTRDARFETVFKDMGTRKIWNLTEGSYNQHAWIGYQFGVRLF